MSSAPTQPPQSSSSSSPNNSNNNQSTTPTMSTSSNKQQQQPPDQEDRISKIIDYLNDPTLDTLPDSLKNSFKYEDGFNPEKLEEELSTHPFFMTELPDPSKPLPPLLEAFQQLKYSETDNTPHELAENHKQDGTYHFKIKKYRIASTCFTTAISHELKSEHPDPKFLATLYNNRSACSWFIQNYRSCAADAEKALGFDKGYFKAFKRMTMAFGELGRWGDVEKLCGEFSGEFGSGDEYSFVCGMRVKARKEVKRSEVKGRKEMLGEKAREEVKRRLVNEVVGVRGIKVQDPGFLNSDAAVDGKVVRFDDGGGGGGDGKGCLLRWPVLFMYPQYSQTDFVEAFPEGDQFIDHITLMLDDDTNAPAWDADREYTSSNVELYYVSSSKLVRVDLESTLLSTLQQPTYVLPGNGVPCFFVLAKSNSFCEDFKERVQLIE